MDNGCRITTCRIRAFDDLDRLQAIRYEDGASAELLRRDYRYDAGNRRVRESDAAGNYWVYGYDPLGQLTGAQRYRTGGDPIPGYTYGYGFDSIGNREQTSVNGRAADWTANALNQYTQRDVPGYLDLLGAADPAAAVTVNGQPATRLGEWFHRAAVVDNDQDPAWAQLSVRGVLAGAGHNGSDAVDEKTGHRFLAEDPEVFTHDADGNLLSDGRWTYTWDAENRLVQMESMPAAVTAGAPKQKLEFAYDSQSRRFRKRVYHWSSSISDWSLTAERRYLYDGWNLLLELDTAGAVINSYTWGLDLSETLQGAGGVGGLLAMQDAGTGAVHLPFYDGNGNVVGLFDTATETLVGEYEYGPFGEVLRATGVTATFGFSTKYADVETGLLYYGYRFYSPDTGRWLSRDPIGEEGGVNLYGFVSNNGVNRVDVHGLSDFWGDTPPWHPSSPFYDQYKKSQQRIQQPQRRSHPVKNLNPVFTNPANRYYGNWGGAGRVNGWDGKWVETDEGWPEQGEPGFIAPIDAYDWCYYRHDRDLRYCACNCTAAGRRECRQKADQDVARCLAKAISDPSTFLSPFIWVPSVALIDSDTRLDLKGLAAYLVFQFSIRGTPSHPSSPDVYTPNSKRCR
jgi:RHS repeat-associated protein